MKLAITSQESGPNALVDLRFGRARFFRIVDTETGQQTTVDNAEGANAVQGAGTHAAETLARIGVQVVITGHVGPKAMNALQAAKIQVYTVDGGTAEQAVHDFLAGRLRALTRADVGGHW
ncbi:MAG TPA: NifB/NifX family molybdenum-iron cluster-binding protein [Verrucomicrobiota bacterium]|nr:NifB/NifX family molybdenum-iron cluster-binding protein [Verrucomicrobiota bacterium]